VFDIISTESEVREMTREEKINTLKAIIQECEDYQWERKETLFEIIKDLEQEQKSEWEHDHEILKAYADGANNVLDKIRAEIETKYGQCDICEYFEDYDYEENDISEYRPIGDIADILQMIDKYKTESER
jgi:hypothetical protein